MKTYSNSCDEYIHVYHAEKYVVTLRRLLQLYEIANGRTASLITDHFLGKGHVDWSIIPSEGKRHSTYDTVRISNLVYDDDSTIRALGSLSANCAVNYMRDLGYMHRRIADLQGLVTLCSTLKSLQQGKRLRIMILTRPEFEFGSGAIDEVYNRQYFPHCGMILDDDTGESDDRWVVLVTKCDAAQANYLSYYLADHLRRDAGFALPVLHYMSDVIYYIADDIQRVMCMYPNSNPKNMMFVNAINYFPCSGVYHYAYHEGGFRIYTGHDGKLWVEASPRGSSRGKYIHHVCSIPMENVINCHGYKICSTKILQREAGVIRTYDGFDSRIYSTQSRVSKYVKSCLGIPYEDTLKSSLEAYMLNRAPQMSIVNQFLRDAEPAVARALEPCVMRFKQIAPRGATDFERIHKHLQQWHIALQENVCLDHSVLSANYWFGSRTTLSGVDVKSSFKFISEGNQTVSTANEDPTWHRPTFPGGSTVPYGTYSYENNDSRRFVFGKGSNLDDMKVRAHTQIQKSLGDDEATRADTDDDEDDQTPPLSVHEQIRRTEEFISESCENVKQIYEQQATRLRDTRVPGDPRATYQNLERYKPLKRPKIKREPFDISKATKIPLVVRHCENSDLPDIDPSQYATDPHFLLKVQKIYDWMYVNRKHGINRCGTIIPDGSSAVYQTRVECDVIEAQAQDTEQVFEMSSKACPNVIAAFNRLLGSPARTDLDELEKFTRYCDHQIGVVGRPFIEDVLRSDKYRNFVIKFNPHEDIVNRKWPEFKKLNYLKALYRSFVHFVPLRRQGVTVFLKKTERIRAIPRIKFIPGTNITRDQRARPRLIAPSHGEEHLNWLEQFEFEFFKTLFPSQFIQGKKPHELRDMFRATIDTIRFNAGKNKCHSYVTDGSSYDSNQTDRVTRAAWHPLVKHYGKEFSELFQENEFFKAEIPDADKRRAYMDNAVQSLCQEFVTFFFPMVGANIDESYWTDNQKEAFKAVRQLGLKPCNVVPFDFACTGSGKNNTTRRNTWNNLLQMAYYFHCQGIENTLWFGRLQNHTCIACAGDDAQGHSSA